MIAELVVSRDLASLRQIEVTDANESYLCTELQDAIPIALALGVNDETQLLLVDEIGRLSNGVFNLTGDYNWFNEIYATRYGPADTLVALMIRSSFAPTVEHYLEVFAPAYNSATTRLSKFHWKCSMVYALHLIEDNDGLNDIESTWYHLDFIQDAMSTTLPLAPGNNEDFEEVFIENVKSVTNIDPDDPTTISASRIGWQDVRDIVRARSVCMHVLGLAVARKYHPHGDAAREAVEKWGSYMSAVERQCAELEYTEE